MKCSECGAKMTTRREAYLYSEESGLPITLAGIEVATCPSCGARGPIVPAPVELNAAITKAIVRKAGRLAGPEIRWLRGILKKNSRELADLLGATPVSVSRWETDTTPAGVPADKLLRVLAAREVKDHVSLDDLAAVATADTGPPMKVTFTHSAAGWSLVQGKQKPAAA